MVKASRLLAALVVVSTVAACADSDTAVVREGEPGWSEIEHPAQAIADRKNPVIVWAGTELVVFGGVRPTGETFVLELLNDGAVFDPSTNAWYPLPAPPFKAALQQPRGLWTGEILVVGGLRCGDKAFWESSGPTNCPAEGFDLAAYGSRSQHWDAIELPDELDRTPCGWLSGSTGTEVIIDQWGAGFWAIDSRTDAARKLSTPPFIAPSICSGDGWVISSGFLYNAEAPGGGDSPATSGSDLRSGQAPHQTSIDVDHGVTVLDAGGG